jgi:hypothetical protein
MYLMIIITANDINSNENSQIKSDQSEYENRMHSRLFEYFFNYICQMETPIENQIV